MSNDFLAKKDQLFFYESLWSIAASIIESLPVLRLTIVLFDKFANSPKIEVAFLAPFSYQFTKCLTLHELLYGWLG